MSVVGWLDRECVSVQLSPYFSLNYAAKHFPQIKHKPLLEKLQNGCSVREVSDVLRQDFPHQGYEVLFRLDILFCLNYLQLLFGAATAPLGTLRLRSRQRRNPLKRCYLDSKEFINKKIVISRFSYFHRTDGDFILDHPLSYARCIITSPILLQALMLCCQKPAGAQEILATVDEESREATRELLGALHLNGTLELVAGANKIYKRQDEQLPEQAQWDFHDLLFHSESSLGYAHTLEEGHHACGASFPYMERFPELPPEHEPYEGKRIFLPDTTPSRGDELFTDIWQKRKSIRKYDVSKPITKGELGVFLSWVYRGKAESRVVMGNGGSAVTVCSSRSYPSGGAIYEQELYLSVVRNNDLATGFYHYDPFTHSLVALPVDKETWQLGVLHPFTSNTDVECPDILFYISARFQRLAWKYTRIAYGLVLKNIGAMYQSMYLVATFMHLAPCSLDGTNRRLFAELTGQDPRRESVVGEFYLGRPIS